MNTTATQTKPPGQKQVYFKQAAEEWGSYPLITIHPAGPYFAYACSLTVFRNISGGHARILNYDYSAKSIFSLKCHFHNDGNKFTYRSDKYPVDFLKQFDNMLQLAKKNLPLTYSMQLYDNRRSAPDDLLIKWVNGEIVFEHANLPGRPTIKDKDIERFNLLAKIYFPKI